MSKFEVSVRKIEKVWNHPNADRLDLSQVEGCAYQFVTGRDDFKPGEEVLYFPVDAVLPAVLINRMGLMGRLSGKEKNRIKTVRLRGEISQGIVARPGVVFGDNPITILEPNAFATKTIRIEEAIRLDPDHLTRILGVTKYEPPIIPCNSANLIGMPDAIGVYDVEGADQFPDIVDALKGEKVCITEKIEGTNFWISCSSSDTSSHGFSGVCQGMLECMLCHGTGRFSGEVCKNCKGKPHASPFRKVSVGQRHHEIQPIEGFVHDFWKISQDLKLDRIVQTLSCDVYGGKRVTLRGEYVGPGVQGNIYKLPENRVYFFDILVDGAYLNPEEFLQTCWTHGLLPCPVLAKDVLLQDWLMGKSIRECSTGESQIGCIPKLLREGIVIKPMTEQRNPKVGRLMIKQRSPEYLAGNDL